MRIHHCRSAHPHLHVTLMYSDAKPFWYIPFPFNDQYGAIEDLLGLREVFYSWVAGRG